MTPEQTELDVNASILKHIGMIRPWIPQRLMVSIGEYASDALRNLDFKNREVSTLFVDKARKGIDPKMGANNNFYVDEKTDMHYWFNVQQNLAEIEAFREKLKNKTPQKLGSAIIVAATSEGIGSFLLPEVASRLKDQMVYSVGFAILPSQLQPPDAFFNSLWCMGKCEGENIAQILVDRDGLEGYIGVDRKGSVLKGEGVFGYLIDLVLAKEFFVQELCELGNSYNSNTFTVLAATGASLRVYGSLENILNTALMKPFSTFDLSSASVLYVVIRMPVQLRRKLSRGSIELTVNKWFKEKAKLKSTVVSQPIYVNDGGDRVDVIMFVGGFDVSKTAATIDSQVEDIVTYAVKNNFLKEKDWRELVKQLKR